MFVSRHLLNSRTNSLYSFRENFLKRNLADKTIQTDAAICFGITVGRQGMICSGSIVTGTSEKLQTEVMAEVERQLAELPRREIAAKSLENSKLILVKDLDEALELLNKLEKVQVDYQDGTITIKQI